MRMSGLAVVTAIPGDTVAGANSQALWFGRSTNTLAADGRRFLRKEYTLLRT
jgi:hypothetical protein